MRIARFLVGGVDIWLNNPRRPMEASGTSGMKAAINGIPSVSHPRRLVGRGLQRRERLGNRRPQADGDDETQDAADAAELYRLLEEEIVPRFFERDADGLPQRVAARRCVPRSTSALWQFSTARMLTEYVDRLYLPAGARPRRRRSPGPTGR